MFAPLPLKLCAGNGWTLSSVLRAWVSILVAFPSKKRKHIGLSARSRRVVLLDTEFKGVRMLFVRQYLEWTWF